MNTARNFETVNGDNYLNMLLAQLPLAGFLLPDQYPGHLAGQDEAAPAVELCDGAARYFSSKVPHINMALEK